MTLNHQLRPLEVNPVTGEPFLRLKRHPDIIVTPLRPEDAEALVPHFNDPRVYKTLNNPPFPYYIEHGHQFVQKSKLVTNRVLRQLADLQDLPTPMIVGSCPVQAIREIQADGSDIFLGDISLLRFRHGELMDGTNLDKVNKEKNSSENIAREIGDPLIVWEVGYWLVPSHHGRGIMTDAFDTLLHEWWVPRMNVRHILGVTVWENEGSTKVFLKNGCKLKGRFEGFLTIGDKLHGINLLEWKYEN